MVSILASFWRGGTSRGLILRAKDLAKFNAVQRDKIVLTALGSPDASGRQIDGLGGGVSSLSKCCLIGLPGEGTESAFFNELGGVPYADEGINKKGKSWDIVYRFAQVPIRDSNLDWASTCGNMLSAVALSSVSSSILPYSTIFNRARSLPSPPLGEPLLFPISILSAATGDVFLARVPLDPLTLEVWEPEKGKGCVIAGVPGEAAGIVLELPLAEGGGLVTGNAKDVVDFEDMKIPVSILSTGLPNIFVSITSLNFPSTFLASTLSTLTSHSTLPSLLERFRVHTANQFSIPLSLSSPKITLIAPMPSEGYSTSADITVAKGEADLMVRGISSGDFHATIPGTTLSALNLGLGIKGTVIEETVGKDSESEKNVVTVRAGHAAGVTSSSLRFEDGKPKSVVMLRTAREIFRGEILIPQCVLD